MSNKNEISEIRSTDVDLQGLLEVLGDNLYSTPIVSIRELIQNAYDAAVRRRVESSWSGTPKIRLYANAGSQKLEIHDNGSGLTRDEIVKYLATIGSGYTRVLRKKTQDESAVGYFGLGFLTSYVVGEQVEFVTTSYQDADAGWRFTSKGGQKYTLTESPSGDVGSVVRLYLKEEYSELSDPDFLRWVVEKYCCLLPVDIYLNDSAQPINQLEIPWKLSRDSYSDLRIKKSAMSFSRKFDTAFEPVFSCPIYGDENCNVKGIVWIQNGSFYSSSDNRMASVFIRSMHITDDCKDLLPAWAGFIGCVIDTPMLTPTASRESVKADDSFVLIKNYIKVELVKMLRMLAIDKAPEWGRVLARHNESLLGAVVSDSALFEAMYDQLSVPTSQGDLKLEAVVNKSPDKNLRISMEVNGGYEQLISRSIGIPVIYGYRFAVAKFCSLAKGRFNAQLLTLGSSDSEDNIFPKYEAGSVVEGCLMRNFMLPKTKVVLSHFEPASLPIIKVCNQDALLKKRIDSDKTDRNIGIAALALAREYTSSIEVESDATLYLNMNNEIISAFSRLDADRQSIASGILLDITHLMAVTGEGDHNNLDILGSLNQRLLRLIWRKEYGFMGLGARCGG